MVETLHQVLSDFLVGFHRNPDPEQELTDLHRDLFSSLYREFAQAQQAFEASREHLQLEYYPERDAVRLNPVRNAYPPKEKFDVVVLDRAQGPPPGQAEDRYNGYWQFPVAFAVNLHFCPDPDSVSKYLRKFKQDQKKMEAYAKGTAGTFRGLSLLLVAGALEDEFGTPAELDLREGYQALIADEDGLFHALQP